VRACTGVPKFGARSGLCASGGEGMFGVWLGGEIVVRSSIKVSGTDDAPGEKKELADEDTSGSLSS